MIIHSPIISGSLTFADGATFTLPDNGIYSGSFSGSLQVHQVQSHLVPDTAFTYDLGSATYPFRDLYISTGSLKGITPGGTVAFKLGSKPGGGLKVTDANDDAVEIEAKEITLKDPSGNGNNIKLKVQNGALKSTKVSNDDVEDTAAEPQTLQSNISGSLIVTGSTTLQNTTINGTIDTTGLASLDGGIDVDGVFTVADSTGNVSTTGTLAAGNTTITGTVDASGLASLDGGIDVDGAFTVADTTGNVSTTGTLAAGNTTITGTVDASGLISADGGLDVDGAFTVADTTGNVSTSGTLSVTGLTTVGVISGSAGNFTGNLSVGGNIIVGGSLTSEGHLLPAAHNTYDLGSTSLYWRDLYLSSGSLYINGIQVLSTSGTDFLVQTDAGENFKIQETGADTITLESANGDITLTATGTGNIELDAPVQIAAGKNILSSDGNAIAFANDVNLGSNKIYAANLSGIISSSAITYSGNDIDVAGNTTIQGNLTVQGTQVQLNTTTLNIEDKNLLIASGALDSAAANGAGITIDGADTTFQWSSAASRMVLNTPIEATKVFTDEIYDSSSTGLTIKSATNFEANNVTIGDGKLILNATAVSATAAELNQLDGNTVGGTTAGDIVTIDGTQTLSNKTINGSQLVDGSVATAKIADLGVTSGKIAADAIDGTKIADDSIDSEHIVDGSVDNVHLANSAITINGTSVSLGGTRTLNADDVAEAVTPTNKYFTDARARGAFSAGTGVSISSGEISIGQAVATNSAVTFASVSATGDIVAYASSDERLKDNIEVISNPIEKVQQLKGVTWDWNDNASELQKSLPNVGVIAQDVEKVLPQLVKDRDNGFKGVDYDKIVGLLIEAIKDQQKQIDDLKSKI